MNPRRLISYAMVFLILVGTYVGLRWRQGQQETREQQAKQVFNLKEAEISALSLKRASEEIQLARQGAAWEITKPLQAKADALAVEDLVKALAQLQRERDLGPGDLKTFGLEQPGLVVSFTAKGEQHRLALGSPAPGGRGYYARKDEAPGILLIGTGTREALDQQLAALRDKTLLAFTPEQVKSIKMRIDQTQVDLEKSGENAWRWTGKPAFKVRADRVEQLLRRLQEARIKEFTPAPPQDLKVAGLAPQARTEVTLMTPQGAETLLLGSGTGAGVYARQGPQGPVVLVNQNLPEQLGRAAASLEDKRLWSGPLAAVQKVVWGPPEKTWTAVRARDTWKITGPDKAELTQAAPRPEMALYNFQNLEYSSLLPQVGAPGKGAFTLELVDGAGKSLFRLEELGKQGETGIAVRTLTGGTAVTAVVLQQNFSRWQEEMARLTALPPK